MCFQSVMRRGGQIPSPYGDLSRKNFRPTVVETVTDTRPAFVTAASATGDQEFGSERFVVDCKVNPAALVGHRNITFAPERVIVSCGGGGGNERLNTVPLAALPPNCAVPYRVLPDKINPADGLVPSVFGQVKQEVAVKL